MIIENHINGHPYLAGQQQLDPFKNTLLFIHGSGSHAEFWEHQLQGFEKEANTVAIDLPGHGKSSKKNLNSITEYADTIESFIRDANIPNPIPCGLSMGGAVVLTLLLDGKLTYPAGILINSGAKLKVMPMIFEMLETNYTGYIDAFKLIAVSEKSDPSICEKAVSDLESINPSILISDFKACDTFDVMDRLHEIEVPVMVLTADDDKLTPSKYGKFMADTIGTANIVKVVDAGHLSPIEQPDAVNLAIQRFVNEKLDQTM
ncbi:MAG: alpha/beta hydrolase [Desulfobacterales bacterium]|nr:alpha/beta hydrolase [Desulfobacterales bacterium]